MAPEKDKLMNHQFDGIQEYDNPIPLWMSFVFAGSILFSILYFPYYHGLDKGDLPTEEYAKEMAAYQTKRTAIEAAKPQVDYAALAANPQAVNAGQQVYSSTCASCHGQEAEGLVGPSLKDAEWINGDGSIKSIASVVKDGVPAKGMPAWAQLGDTKIQNVSAFIFSIQDPDSGASTAASDVVDSNQQAAGTSAHQTFASVCASCHGADAKGDPGPGPDLTDSVWINGTGELEEIRGLIWNGVIAKGMPPWSSLGEEAVNGLTQYVFDLSH